MTEQELMKYFEFDETDLNANRNGSLSQKQYARLSKSDKSDRKKSLVIGLVSATLAILPTLILWMIDKLKFVGWYSLAWMIPLGLIAFVLIRVGTLSTVYTLKKVEGDIEIVRGGAYSAPEGIFYELQLGGKCFGIGPEFASRMKKDNGETYVVYYYIDSYTTEDNVIDANIMSLEKISKREKQTKLSQ